MKIINTQRTIANLEISPENINVSDIIKSVPNDHTDIIALAVDDVRALLNVTETEVTSFLLNIHVAMQNTIKK